MDVVPSFQPLTGIYEPSGIVQLADGRFLVVEDEKEHPFSLVTLNAAARVESRPLLLAQETRDTLGTLNDLEALAVDKHGYVYAATSHSRTDAGKQKPSRDKLVRFRISGERLIEPVMVTSLKSALTARHRLLADAAEIRDVKVHGGFNIEALEFTADGRRLLIGFRSPLRDGRALIACIENPHAVFEAGDEPRIGERLIALDLGEHGLRGMAYVPAFGGYLLVSGPITSARVQFRLWFWSGVPGERPRAARVPGLRGFEHAEGIAPARIDGRPFIVIVSDDGDRGTRSPAGFLLLNPEELVIAAS